MLSLHGFKSELVYQSYCIFNLWGGNCHKNWINDNSEFKFRSATWLWGFFETFLIHQVFCGRWLCLSWIPGLTGCYEERGGGAFCPSHHLGHLKLIIWSWLRHKASLHEKSPRQTARQYGGCCPAGRTHHAGMCLIKRQMPYFEFVFAALQGGVTAIVLL